ncbi:hypothetical protein COU59_01400 [Candidatus Pacearchaeota archaeon CG10_big_fil_rev_8_21_14_0_10_34_12]|nr:MAG: hypothetical protein COU59_01400 [Candidatus Pacearchaeota archaeon CG10_big_fil_rev_8_21_14_0_10_34_12]
MNLKRLLGIKISDGEEEQMISARKTFAEMAKEQRTLEEIYRGANNLWLGQHAGAYPFGRDYDAD